jgi:hypothetical protein
MATAIEVGPLFSPVSFLPGVPTLLPPPAAVTPLPLSGAEDEFVGPLYDPVFFLPSAAVPGGSSGGSGPPGS